ncbi:MAG: hypothetical protein AAF432_14080 [Planctomycetota bacterium]
MIRRALAIMVTVGLLTTSSVAEDVVVLRGGMKPIAGTLIRVTDVGAEIRSSQGATHVVRWDQVRDVLTDRTEPDLPRLLDQADQIWRAKSRLERQDIRLAEPLFVRLFERYRGQTNETALVVAEGLLRCRIERGANDEAIVPWLETVRIRRAGVVDDPYATLGAVLDTETMLCPRLAPYFVPTRSLVNARRELMNFDHRGDPYVRALAQRYVVAIDRVLQRDATPGVLMEQDDAALQLLDLLLELDADDAQQRADARDTVRVKLVTTPATSWQDAWYRLGLGRAMTQTTGVGRQQRGIVNLLYVPARHAADLPYLSGLALDWSAGALESIGDSVGAERVRAELDQRFPGHPVRPVSTDLSGRTAS